MYKIVRWNSTAVFFLVFFSVSCFRFCPVMCRLSKRLLVHVRRCGLPLKMIHWLIINEIHRDFSFISVHSALTTVAAELGVPLRFPSSSSCLPWGRAIFSYVSSFFFSEKPSPSRSSDLFLVIKDSSILLTHMRLSSPRKTVLIRWCSVWGGLVTHQWVMCERPRVSTTSVGCNLRSDQSVWVQNLIWG